MTETDPTTITRVALRNSRALRPAVKLTPLTFLVGPNGSGKSNFLDALRFTAQRVAPRWDQRGSTALPGHPNHFGIRLDLRLSGATAWYAFEIGARPKGRYVIRREECIVQSGEREQAEFFRIENGRLLRGSISHPPPTGGSDRLYLLPASGYPAFRPVYDTLAGMGFYNLNPEQIRELQSPDPGDLLKHDGAISPACSRT